jgi:2-oxoglutarate ferredoxin oxidoreductase subunit beta
MAATALTTLTPKDLASDQEVRWCPGCGDYSVLAQLKQTLASLGVPRERFVFVSGIGCSSRLPYYLNVYGFHTVHGRALTVATGLKLLRPELSVWVATGDGDALSAGGNHLLHALRRNVDLKILLFNNEVFGLTKGQYSPTSRLGTRTRSSPHGSIDRPLRPLTIALAAEATFAARTIDVDVAHLGETLRRAAAHRGSAFVEIYQNCKIFNDGVFDYATDCSAKADSLVYLENGRPLVFGRDRNKAIRLRGLRPEVVHLGNGAKVGDLLVHDERAADDAYAHLLSRMNHPELPEAVGVLRCIERPTYGDLLDDQIAEAIQRDGAGELDELFAGEDSWVVESSAPRP